MSKTYKLPLYYIFLEQPKPQSKLTRHTFTICRVHTEPFAVNCVTPQKLLLFTASLKASRLGVTIKSVQKATWPLIRDEDPA